jgi:hypothetical protein
MEINLFNAKKGIFFTFASIILSLIIILSFNTYNNYSQSASIEVLESRINTMNRFISDLQADLKNAMHISGFRSILSVEDHIMDNDDFLDNLGTSLEGAFKEAFLNGTIQNVNKGLMENNTIINWTDKMKTQAKKTGIELEFTIYNVSILQSEPWMVDIILEMNISVNDTKGTASWNIIKNYTKKINISSFVDPLYIVNNNGLVNNTLLKSSVDPSASESNLDTHLLNSYYIQNSNAPSYIMRFENNLGSSEYGIESLVNSQERVDAGLSALDRSAVDYLYFGSGSTTNCVVDTPEYTWFKLDYLPDPPNHLDFYNTQCD